MRQVHRLGRRGFCRTAAFALAGAPGSGRRAAAAVPDNVVRVLGVSTGALADWSRFEADTGLKMQWTPASDDVGVFLHEMIADDAGEHYDLVTCLSGSYAPLVAQDLLLPINLAQLQHWQGVERYVGDVTPAGPAAQTAWSLPYHMGADSFLYVPHLLQLPAEPTPVSWKLLYDDERTKGRVAIDNEIYALGCAAIYLDYHKLVRVADIGNMTASECGSVADYLIERKQAGQFRSLYKSYDEQVQLLKGGEVVAETGWEPVQHELQATGQDVSYATTVEGYDKWSQNLMIPAQVKDRGGEAKVHATIDWLLGGSYAAELITTRGYATPRMDLALDHARAQGWDQRRIDAIQAVMNRARVKFAQPLYWDPGYYPGLEYYEREMARFRNA